jgi:Na+/glutamate symporter
MNGRQNTNKKAPKNMLKVIGNITIELIFFFVLAMCLGYIITRNLAGALNFTIISLVGILIVDIILYVQRKQVGLMGFNFFK